MEQHAGIFLRNRGWEYVQGAGAHSYWRRPASQRQKKRGTIYIRQIAVKIQNQIEREDEMAAIIASLPRGSAEIPISESR